MTPTRSVRRSPAAVKVPARRALPEAQPLRLPNGYYDPDSAAFDDRTPADLDELFRSTTPAEPAAALRPVAS
jgi:hypothetical protein